MNRKELYNQFKTNKIEIIEEIKKYCEDVVKEYNKKNTTNYVCAPADFNLLDLEKGIIIKVRYESCALTSELMKVSFSDFLENRVKELIYL